MFGIVPKPLWSRAAEPDQQNRILLQTNCVLVHTASRRVLIDTGYGTRLSPKEQAHLDTEPPGTLLANLQTIGCSPDEIDVVILSHLHFDHAGGGVMQRDDGTLAPTFPNATYVVQQREWEAARCEDPEWKGIYRPDDVVPLMESGQLHLVSGQTEVAPGITVFPTGGHTPGHQVVMIQTDKATLVYLGDICPTWAHLRVNWCMAYDLDVIQVRRMKHHWLNRIAESGWIALSDHDPVFARARLVRDPQGRLRAERVGAGSP